MIVQQPGLSTANKLPTIRTSVPRELVNVVQSRAPLEVNKSSRALTLTSQARTSTAVISSAGSKVTTAAVCSVARQHYCYLWREGLVTVHGVVCLTCVRGVCVLSICVPGMVCYSGAGFYSDSEHRYAIEIIPFVPYIEVIFPCMGSLSLDRYR